jgi:hypothetical protein
MAVITPKFTSIVGPNGGVDAIITTWGPIGDADTCLPMQRPDYADKSIQVEGTFAGATIVIEGSNDSTTGLDGHFRPLRNPEGVVLNFIAGDIQQTQEATLWFTPVTSGGAGSSLTVTAMCRRSFR